MDDILLAHKNEPALLQCYDQLQKELEHWGLKIAPEKVQWEEPYTY